MWNLSAIEKSLEYEKKGIVSTTAVLNFLTMNFRVWQLSTPLKIVFDAMMTHKIQYQWVIRNHTPSGVWILNQFFDILKLSQVKPTAFKIYDEENMKGANTHIEEILQNLEWMSNFVYGNWI